MNFNWRIFLWFAFLSMMGCKRPYIAPVIEAPGSYLVVEGVINSGSDSTLIKLSKTVKLTAKTTAKPVLNATLIVENENGGIYPLADFGGGKYGSAGLNLDNNQKYRLRISTADNREYLSDFVPVVNAPPIDTFYYTIQNNGIQFNLSTHDPKNQTHYYRWDYQETWVVHPRYYSFYRSTGDTVIERKFPDEQVYQCWQSDTSSTIVLGSTAALSNDVLNNIPVTFAGATSGKFYGKLSIIISQFAPTASSYSIQVREFALTGDAYLFWSTLKKNTELTGSVFDAQPSHINGNIYSLTNNLEPVLGYISVGAFTSKRIFITNGQVPDAWEPINAYTGCKLDSLYLYTFPPTSPIPINQEDEFFNFNKDARFNPSLIQTPIAVLINPINGKVIGHTGSSPVCSDCTLKGTNKQPAFWK